MGYSFQFKFSENEIDFSPKSGNFFNYDKFLLNEFFNASNKEMYTIMMTYRKKFGEGAYNHVMKTYFHDWRRGSRTISNVQEGRILFIMPELLNETARSKLNKIKEEAQYKRGIEEILGAIKRTVHYFFRHHSIYSREKIVLETDILKIFEKEIERAKLLEIPQKNSYSSDENFYVLNEDEKKEALLIAQYIVFVKLQKQFDQIQKDFNTFLPYMNCIKRGIFNASYSIKSLNLNVDITKTHFNEITIPQFKISEIEANSRFKQYSDKYLAAEMVTLHHNTNKSISNSFLNSNDLQLFFNHYDELSLSDSEINMKSIFNGEGGTLNIQVQMKPIKMLRTSIAKSTTKLLIYTIAAIGIISLTIGYKLYALLIFGGIYLIGFYISVFSEEIKQIKILKSELKQYGQQ